MRFSPWRRWFQFRLSTWFVLVAILAWAMTCRPYYGWTITRRSGTPIEITGIVEEQLAVHRIKVTKLGRDAAGRNAFIEYREQINRQLAWPALALLSFLAWKAAWGIAPRFSKRRCTMAE